MARLKNRKTVVVLMVVLALVFGTVAVNALVVTVDGDDTGDWGTNPLSCTIGSAGCSRAISDPVDVTSPPAAFYDIINVGITNDATNLYVRLDFEGNGDATTNTWIFTVTGRPILTICFDLDDDTSTGVTRTAGNCDGDESMTGVDYFVRLTADEFNPNVPSISLVNCSSGTCVGAAHTIAFGYDADADAITEIGIPMANLGITPGTCPDGGTQPPGCSFRMGLYYDNGVAPSDDSVPDNGYATAIFGGGSPTAVSLQSVTANSSSPTTALILGSALMLAVVSVGFVLYRRQEQAH